MSTAVIEAGVSFANEIVEVDALVLIVVGRVVGCGEISKCVQFARRHSYEK